MNWLKWITNTRKVITFYRENYELIKSVVLTVLIVLSLFLTWSLWTYKPSHPFLQETKTVKKQEVEDQATLNKVVYPTQVIFHKGDELYGVEAHEMMKQIHDQIKIADFNFDPNVKNNQLFDPNEKIIKNEDYIEIIYPVGLTKEIYKEVFSFDAEISASKPQYVDRLLLYQSKTPNIVEGYLVSYQTKKMQKIRVDNFALTSVTKDIAEKVGLIPYISYDIEERTEEGAAQTKNRFYFPRDSIKLNRYHYISRAINEETKEKYKKALFKDQLAVKSASTGVNEITFTDGNAVMVINELKNRFTYTNFAGLNKRNFTSSNSPLFQSIDYINTHAGWGGPYILSELAGDRASFWLQVASLPVLDPDTFMSLSWAENELYQYERSMIDLDFRSTSELIETVPLISGKDVVRELKESDYNENYIKDVRIGLTMKRQSEPHVYVLEPRWFINYENKGWIPLFKKDREEGF
ncbi:hypothetical protein KUV80_12725 [Fictibacillus nanhaiensis]|uniref:YycH family regulatory protein n=1 Tax=Fictibacillus nanhaiensis TaxID=742169 RepID=UPI001C973C9D|nr:hypothetical protein [Fictibacillus nanhaiensis]